MADITKIQPMGDSTQYNLLARGLKHADQIKSSTDLDNFLESNVFKVATFDTKSEETNTTGLASKDGLLLSMGWTGTTTYGFQLIIDDAASNTAKIRAKNSTWANWSTLLHENNYTTWTVKKDGTGASGTWGISISGNAATATKSDKSKLTAVAEADCIPSGYDEFQMFRATSTTTGGGDGYIGTWRWSSGGYLTQLYVEVDPTWRMALRHRNNSNEWTAWKQIPMGDGTNASGTWGISITGTATYAQNLTEYSGNECTVCGTNANSTNTDVYINYRSCRGGTTSDGAATVGAYRFCNRKGSANAAIYAGKVYGAVWNDIAETRNCKIKEPGTIVIESNDGEMRKCTKHRHAGAKVISDTFGYCMGQITDTMQPIAIAGRVLVNIDTNKEKFKLGMPVCSGLNGGVVPMKWYEKILWPECIVGFVSEIPNYDTWYGGSLEEDGKLKPYKGDPIPVNNRIWIYVK